MKIQLFIIFLPMVLSAKKNFNIEHVVDCPGEEKFPVTIHFDVNNTANVPNKIFFSGYLEVIEKVSGPLEIAFEANRCDLKAEKCEKFSSMKVPGVCKFLNNKNGLFSDVMNSIEPRFKCPLMPGKYVIPDSTVDVSNFAILPIDGWRWVTTLKGTSGDDKNRKLAICLRIDALITNAAKKGK